MAGLLSFICSLRLNFGWAFLLGILQVGLAKSCTKTSLVFNFDNDTSVVSYETREITACRHSAFQRVFKPKPIKVMTGQSPSRHATPGRNETGRSSESAWG